MKVSYCDRCGKKISEESWGNRQLREMTNANQRLEPEYKIQRKYCGLFPSAHVWEDCDFCQECIESLREWMKEGGADGETRSNTHGS